MNIIDVFVYHGEPVAELRLQLLAPYVTEFVVAYDPNEAFLNMPDVFAPYIDKVTFIPCACLIRAQEYVMRAFDDFIAVVSAADEIPSPEFVKDVSGRYFALHDSMRLQMHCFDGNFDKKFAHGTWHTKAFCVNDMGARRHKFADLRDVFAAPHVPEAGWYVPWKSALAGEVDANFRCSFLPPVVQDFAQKLAFLRRYTKS